MSKKPIAVKLTASNLLKKDGVSYLIPYILISLCFALWGFANDMTGPIVKAFTKIFRMSVTEGSFVQVAYFLGYFSMAIPAAIFITRYSFKSGVLLGLSLFGLGALMFIPAKAIGYYYPFLLAYFISTCGLSFIETSSNPYIYCMGPEETATQRLNLAQAFNSIGALVGMFIAKDLVQARMSPMTTVQRHELTPTQFEVLKDSDLGVLIQPYIILAAICILLLVIIRITKMPVAINSMKGMSMKAAFRELLSIKNYREGLIAQFFYIGAQVSCWTFIIQYGTHIFMTEGISEKEAEIMSQNYNIMAMAFFTISRFVCTFFLSYVPAGRLLSILAICAIAFTGGTILFPNRNGLYCLVAVSACMSLMFPTIYGISLRGMGDRVKIAGAGQVMAILGGSVLPPIQALIIDWNITLFGVPSVNLSFIIPLLCFMAVAIYGHHAYVRQYIWKIIE